jgi:hypothetical protein
MAEKYGLWPGVVAIVGDADLWCVSCAAQYYGNGAIQAVIDGKPGYERYTDFEGNPLGVVLSGSENLHTAYCSSCGDQLCDEECICYQPGQAEHWHQYGSFLEPEEEES